MIYDIVIHFTTEEQFIKLQKFYLEKDYRWIDGTKVVHKHPKGYLYVGNCGLKELAMTTSKPSMPVDLSSVLTYKQFNATRRSDKINNIISSVEWSL
jgi:hypothetical protein